MIASVLSKFGIPFFSVVKNGYLAVNVANVSLDQSNILMKYTGFIAMFNPVTRRAGFTNDWFDAEYPDGYSKTQWTFPSPPDIRDFLNCNDPRTHFFSGLEHDSLMKEANDLLSETNRDTGLSPITDCLRYHHARNRISGNLSNKSQKSIEDEIHRIDPRIVSFNSSSPSIAIDGIVCKMVRCLSQECPNNRSHADQFAILIQKWKDTDEYKSCHYSTWKSAEEHAPLQSKGLQIKREIYSLQGSIFK
jgi:hypothetical protein